MFRYNLYVFDRVGGLIIHYHHFEADSHETAIARVADYQEQRPMELWSDDLLIMNWPSAV